jgi:hypothetical protein
LIGFAGLGVDALERQCANNNTNIKAALETTNTKSSESHSKAEIKFVIKNEYAQIIPAVKAVKVFNDKFNLSFAMRFARFGVGGFKGCFDVGIVVGGEVYVSICGG